jgi:hypothetical protein
MLSPKLDLLARGAHKNSKFAGRSDPIVLGGIEVRKCAVIQNNGDRLGFTGTWG